MNEWTPKVGDKVMVGVCGPYEVEKVSTRTGEAYISTPVFGTTVLFSWLTPAPEPEPDEPTAPGALVRDGDGTYLARSTDDDYPWVQLSGSDEGRWERWVDRPRPITVVLADPAEVEQLRAEVGVLREQSDSFLTQRDELRRRIDKVLSKDREWGGVLYEAIRQILRGES